MRRLRFFPARQINQYSCLIPNIFSVFAFILCVSAAECGELQGKSNCCIYNGVFSWDARKAIANFEKHRISFEEAATVFGDANALDADDEEHSSDEHRRQRIGRSVGGRIVFVVYTVRRVDHEKETIRIISARQASRRERAAYSRLTD
jgi:uncharacterized DUF497 family protein